MNLGFPLVPEAASTIAGQVDALTLFGVVIAVFFSTLIAILILYLALRYRRRHPDEIGQREKTITWLEITWSVIPLAILMFMFAWGAKVFFEARRPPADAAEYFVTGKQWMWKFQHPEGPREINELHVPVGQPIKLTMTSEDVIHSFFVPAFRVKMDVIPGRYTTVWFEATKTGTFDLFCAEYCGAEHSLMVGSIVVMEPREYEEWLATRGDEIQTVSLSGEELFVAKTCATCHRPDSAVLGPILHGLYGREEVVASGERIVVDENYLRESILDPMAKITAGYENSAVMPTFQGQLTEEELAGLIAYIKSIGPSENGEQAAIEPAASREIAP